MVYTTVSDIRVISGITEDEISNSILTDIIEYAEAEILRQINVRMVDEDLDPDLDGTGIDGSNVTFYTKNKPIADINRDSTIDSNDIIVYVWDNEQDESTKNKVTVSTVQADSGRVVLETAPAKNKERISANYSYHKNTIDYTLVTKASAYLTAYLAVLRLSGRLPISYTLGRALRVNTKDMGHRFYHEYLSILNMINVQTSQHKKSPKSIR